MVKRDVKRQPKMNDRRHGQQQQNQDIERASIIKRQGK